MDLNRFSDHRNEANPCLSAVKAAAPACADDSWVLWEGRNNGFFCCEPNQIGVIAGRGVVGSCVDSGVQVTQSATRVSLVFEFIDSASTVLANYY